MRRTIRKTIAAGLMAASPLMFCSSARSGEFFDFLTPYFQRRDSITPGAGNAKDLNAVTHMIDPWPRHARDRRIPANGERMTGAVERYRDVSKLRFAPPPISQVPMGGTASPGSGATAAPVMPSSPPR